MDLATFIADMVTRGYLAGLAGNPMSQFGPLPTQQPYLGAQLLPEQIVPDNYVTETGMRTLTLIANSGSRYSPAQLKDTGDMVGQFSAILADSDIARQFTGRDYDGFLEMLRNTNGGRPSMDASARILGWLDDTIVRGLADLNELQRWQAIVDASVIRRGDNDYIETVAYPNPAGHRVAAGGAWTLDTYDPYVDILAMADLLRSKGFPVARIVTSTKVTNFLLGNDMLVKRFGDIQLIGAPINQSFYRRMSLAQLNGGLALDGLPAIETYEAQYRDTSGRKRFMPDNVMCFFGATGAGVTVDVVNGQTYLPDTVGYFAIGRAVGQNTPGRVIKLFAHENKPPGMMAEGWQTALPIITNGEAFGVITGIA